MERRLRDVLEGKGENYILPFFWQHGDSRERLEEGMDKIFACGIRAVCVESRPHPDFVGEGWWRDMDIIMEKAKELGMRVWVLDDAHFPSGYCNGRIGSDSLYRKKYLTRYSVDVIGPMQDTSFLVKLEENEHFVGAVAAKRDRNNKQFMGDVLDISDRRRGDFLEWDVPEGFWCVTIIKITDKGTGRPGYINSIDRDSVRFFLDTVYEPHYERYKEEFGKTFAGFFSDEPEIGNTCGEYGHNACIGQPTMNLPWSDHLEGMLRERWGDEFCINLMALWQTLDTVDGGKNKTGELRAEFMDYVTQLYGANFCGQIGEWCRVHGVEYIGHVIEDGGSHARLGLGTGHYFRALWGQDMAGIDVVLQQIRPQLDDTAFYRIGGKEFYYGEFYHYGLAKMGTSLGHIDPKKKGRTICEIFGAYGWTEGVKFMKWLTDHMLVRGVNYYVPHAFTMKDFPDPDCPPHFYARGMNPQYPYFQKLMQYLNRVCHLISGGVHRSCVAVLYTAELEWMDRTVMQFESVGRILAQNQVDYEVLPVDILVALCPNGGKLPFGAPVYDEDAYVGREEASALILPECKCIPRKLATWCQQTIKNGFPIVSIHSLPKILEENGDLNEWEAYQPDVVELDALGSRMNTAAEIHLSSFEPYLRYYHYVHKDGEYYLFFNESVTETVDTTVLLPVDSGTCIIEYDAWQNCLKSVDLIGEVSGETDREAHTGRGIGLSLSPYEMKIICVGSGMARSNEADKTIFKEEKHISLDRPWKLSLKKAGEDRFIYERDLFLLKNITSSGFLPDFSGTMKYETTVDLSWNADTLMGILDLGRVYETAEVWVNGLCVGCRITPPYRFEIGNVWKKGKNTITVVVTNTLVHQQKDPMSVTMPVEPSGLLGPVHLTIGTMEN